jgi:hypothetical protein
LFPAKNLLSSKVALWLWQTYNEIAWVKILRKLRINKNICKGSSSVANICGLWENSKNIKDSLIDSCTFFFKLARINACLISFIIYNKCRAIAQHTFLRSS